MPEVQYSRSGPWREQWPMSRIVRYCFIFASGALAGHVLLTLPTEYQATSRQQAIARNGRFALDKQELDNTVREAIRTELERIERRKKELDNTVREAIRGEFERIQRGIFASESSSEASADPARTSANESNRYLAQGKNGVQDTLRHLNAPTTSESK